MLAKLSVDQALIKAKSHANRGEIEEAKRLYQSILLNFSKNKRAQQGLSNLNKFSRITTTQDPPQETINELINLYKQGQFSLAVEQAQILTKQYPDNFMIWNILGASAAQIDMNEEAIIAFKKVISIKPEYPDAYGNMGLVLQEQGKLDEAIEAYKKAISLKPDYAEAYNSLGNAYKDITKLDKAIEAYKQCIFLKPSFFNAYYNMGNIFQAQDKLDEAINAYKKSIILKANYADAYNNMGNALQDQGKLVEAIKAYKQAIAIKPDYADAYYNMGIALKDQG